MPYRHCKNQRHSFMRGVQTGLPSYTCDDEHIRTGRDLVTLLINKRRKINSHLVMKHVGPSLTKIAYVGCCIQIIISKRCIAPAML